MTTLDIRHETRSKARARERREFQLLLVIAYPIFLVAVACQGVVDALRRPGRRPPGRRSIFAEARAAAVAVIPFAFSG